MGSFIATTTDIEELLAASGLRPQDMPSPRQLTAALRAAALRRGAQQGRHGWYAKAVTTCLVTRSQL